MNTEQERADFEAFASKHGLCVTEDGDLYRSHVVAWMWKAWQARAALQSQPQETIAYVTRNEEGDPAMLFFDLKEARLYCNPDEEPEALVLAGSALQSQDRGDVKRPVLDSIVDEIHRRADKEWADDGYDFEVTITADEYKALCEEEKAIDHARRVEGES